MRERIRGAAGLVTSTTISSPPPRLLCWMSPGATDTRSTPISTNRRMPLLVRRSPQFIASFSNSAFARVPTRRGLAGSATFQTRSVSTPLVTNSGAVRRKQPEMPACEGWTPRWAIRSLSSAASVLSRTRERSRSRSAASSLPSPEA